ncbi:hypothetical protein C8R43DRAFT_941181 [Mycena crocata]|nr:hypothetical protein C8R43DRAFT_941181 [Mycena crocata]
MFFTEHPTEFRIGAERLGMDSSGKSTFVKAPVWCPPILHPVFKFSLVLVVATTIVGLEVGLRKADIIKGLQTGVSTLEPFFAMHRSPQAARKSVLYSPASTTEVGLVFHSWKAGSLVGLACAATMLTIPFLKIAVSGLIDFSSEPTERSAFLAAITIFNTTLPTLIDRSADIPKQMLALSQIQEYQLPLPAWTAPDAAVAQLNTMSLLQLVQGPNTTIKVPLDVLRAELGNCSSVNLDKPITEVLPEFVLPLPSSPGWFGRAYLTASLVSGSSEPGYTFVYGQTQPTNSSQIQSATIIKCLSYTFTVATRNVTLGYVNGNVGIVSIAASTIRTIPSNQLNFPMDPPPATAHEESGIPATQTFETNSSLAFDTVFQIMTLKNTSTPLETFLDPAELTAAAQSIFATYGAIYVSLHQRIPIPEPFQHPIEVTALLGCVLCFGLITAILVRQTNNVLTKPPYSIGAVMGLLSDSAFVELEELRTVRNERDLERILDVHQFQLGWGNNSKGGMRFGVDIVRE